MADKCIGKLTLDITDIEKKTKSINELLGKMGVGAKVDLSSKINAEVKKQLDSVLKEIKSYEGKMSKAVDDVINKATAASNKKVESESLKEATKAWKEYYQLMTKAQSAFNSGKNGKADFYTEEANKLITDRIRSLKDEAEAQKTVTDAMRAYKAAIQDGADRKLAESQKASATAVREQAKELETLNRSMERTAQLADNVAAKREAAQERETAAAQRAADKELEATNRSMEQVAQLADRVATAQEAAQEREVAATQRAAEKREETYRLMFARIQQEEDRARESQTQMYTEMFIRAEENALNSIIEKYKEYFDWKTKATNAEASGNTAGANAYMQNAHQAYDEIKRLTELYPDLMRVAEASDEVRRAQAAWMNSITSSAAKEMANDVKANEQAITDYANALQKMLTAQADMNNQLASGKLSEDSEKYKALEQELARLEAEAIKFGQRLNASGREAAMGMEQVQSAMAKVKASEAALADSSNVSPLRQMEDAYKNLTTAIKNYSIAQKSGDQGKMDYWKNQVNASMAVVSNIENGIKSLNIEESERQKILNLIEQCKTAQTGFNNGIMGGTHATNELESQLTSLATRFFSIMAVIRAINNLIKNTVEYVSEYSAKMTEIQMITLKTDAEVAQLADKYREMAKEMSVSSLEMADAAVYFTRQGLSAVQIEDRLRNVTMYAKAANVEFKDASEIITAVVNSMGLLNNALGDGRTAAERVADVFLMVGDNAATSGQEIGEAMQKAAASAGAFGVEFEWLAAYIATVSETTRQEARTIGTAFNTIIARLHQIKQQGYNSEDETKINDIAKALSKIDVALMDQYGNWRDMDTILQEIAAKWGDLDGKTKSYIATTMAGVKQQNVFLALMKDMSKGANNGSRAFELYGKAIDSAGTSAEKYAVYLDSVEASQERLTVAQEKFYSLLDDSVIKTWNNFWAGLLNNITSAADRSHGLSIILPVIAAGVTTVMIAISGLNLKLGETVTLTAMLQAHPIMMALAAGAAMLVAGVTILGNVLKETETYYDQIQSKIEKTKENVESAKQLQKDTAGMFGQLGDKVKLTSEDFEDYNGLLDQLARISPRAAEAVDNLKNGMWDQQKAAEVLNEELDKTIERESKIGMIAMKNRLGSWTPNFVGGTGAGGIGKGFDLSVLDNGEQGMEAFAAQLSKGYYHSRALQPGGSILVSDAMKKTIEEEWNSRYGYGLYSNEYLQKADPSEVKEFWLSMAYKIWSEYLVGEDFNSVEDYITKDAEKLIDDVVQTVGNYLEYTDFQKGLLGKKLREQVFGEDGILSMEEWESSGDVLLDFMKRTEQSGGSNITFNPEDNVRYLAEIFEVQLPKDLKRYLSGFKGSSNYEEMCKDIASAYEEIVAAGFEAADIEKMYKEVPVGKWDKMAFYMARRTEEQIKKNLGTDRLGMYGQDENGKQMFSTLMWNELDLATLKTIADLTESGVTLEQINQLMIESGGNVEVFKNKLVDLQPVLQETEEEQQKTFTDAVKSLKEYTNELKKLDGYIETLKSGKPLSGDDLLDLFGAHPELIQYANDLDTLRVKLEGLREETAMNMNNDVYDLLMTNEDFFANSPFAHMTDENGETYKNFAEYVGSLDDGSEELKEASAYLNGSAANIMSASESMRGSAESWLAAHQKVAELEAEQNWAKSNNYIFQIAELEDALKSGNAERLLDTWYGFSDEMRKDIADTYPGLAKALYEVEKAVRGADEATQEAYEKTKARRKDLASQMTELFPDSNVDLTNRPIIDTSKLSEAGWGDVEPGYATLFSTTYTAGEEGIPFDKNVVVTVTPIMPNGEVLSPENLDAYVEGLIADSTSKEDIINKDKVENGGYGLLIGVDYDFDNTTDGPIQNQEFMAGKLHELQEEYYDTAEASDDLKKATQGLNDELGAARKRNEVKYFKNTADAMVKLEKGTISATDAYEVYYKEAEKVVKAGDEIVAAQAKMAEGTKLETGDVDALASLLGKTTDEVLQDFPAAVAEFDNLTSATGELRTMMDDLNKAAFIRITGVSEADFSNIENGLLVVGDMAKDTIKLLEATGQWELDTRKLDGEMSVFENGKIVKKKVTGYQDVLVATGKNPYASHRSSAGSTNKSSSSSSKSSSGGGGGGGGGGGSNRTGNEMTEVERMLDLMSKLNAIQGTQRSYYQAQQGYYSQTGQIQGVIGYMQKEQDVLENQNVTLEENIRRIEEYMNKKRAELSSLSLSDERYEEVADDLDKLQKAHQDYTAELVNNKTAIEQLTKSMDEQRKKIRTMEINLRNTILQAIKDREEKAQKMLNAEVQMENIILDLIKKRYEKERDHIIETTDMKIESLQKERDMLDEQLRIRREQAEEEDKMLKLRELEAQYQRIIADPTRAKEAQKIKAEIDDLREEMAWDLAEKEVEAQQDSIDQQITSLEDYEEYINNYYEDLFEHPQKLIEEMRNIMMMTQEEIMNWLMANDEEYQNSSENTRKVMLQGWEDTYNDMKGIIKTYWDEVEEIIAQGDDYIIEFLKNNSKAYAEAGKLQAEAYVDEWKKQLYDLHKAYENVTLDIAADYDVIQQAMGNLANGGNGGGVGGGGGGDLSALTGLVNGFVNGLNVLNVDTKGAGGSLLRNGIVTNNRVNMRFATGGVAEFSGPAWLDGSPSAPERVLSPYQTALFETMVSALESINKISVPGMPNMNGMQSTGGNPVSVGDIVVNVDNLDTDDDYEELAQKVSDILMERIGRTAVVGGLRIRSI